MNRELWKIYRRNKPALLRTEEHLQEILERTQSSIENKYIVRAEIQPTRIKKYSSLKRKVVKNNWPIKTAFKRCGDLVGGRVTCNNIEDVYRFCQILKENVNNSGYCKINGNYIQYCRKARIYFVHCAEHIPRGKHGKRRRKYSHHENRRAQGDGRRRRKYSYHDIGA